VVRDCVVGNRAGRSAAENTGADADGRLYTLTETPIISSTVLLPASRMVPRLANIWDASAASSAGSAFAFGAMPWMPPVHRRLPMRAALGMGWPR
jgi:hypothetical protein